MFGCQFSCSFWITGAGCVSLISSFMHWRILLLCNDLKARKICNFLKRSHGVEILLLGWRVARRVPGAAQHLPFTSSWRFIVEGSFPAGTKIVLITLPVKESHQFTPCGESFSHTGWRVSVWAQLSVGAAVVRKRWCTSFLLYHTTQDRTASHWGFHEILDMNE